jgi:hypothetical protein
LVPIATLQPVWVIPPFNAMPPLVVAYVIVPLFPSLASPIKTTTPPFPPLPLELSKLPLLPDPSVAINAYRNIEKTNFTIENRFLLIVVKLLEISFQR